MILPSKDLLSAVFGRRKGFEAVREVYSNTEYNNILEEEEKYLSAKENEIVFVYRTDMQGMGWSETEKTINIYELTHMMKEWAVAQGYSISIYFGNVFRVGIYSYNENSEKYSEVSDTEPEAIFKACEWILKETK